MPLKAPIAFFDNSLSYASSGDEELIELTANFDDEEDECGENSSAFHFDNESFDKDKIDEKRQKASNYEVYEVRDEMQNVVLKQCLPQAVAPAVVTMVADLEFIKFKVKNLRRRWSVIQTWQNQDTDFGFSDVSMDKVEEKKNKLPGSVDSLPSDDAEVNVWSVQPHLPSGVMSDILLGLRIEMWAVGFHNFFRRRNHEK